jgi:DNA-binding CsgD family transcriptional regulator
MSAATSLARLIEKPKLRGVNSFALSEREEQVVKLIAEGLQSKEISAVLNISAKTVDTHRNNIYRKLLNGRQGGSIVDLVHYALAHGLVANKFELTSFYGS